MQLSLCLLRPFSCFCDRSSSDSVGESSGVHDFAVSTWFMIPLAKLETSAGISRGEERWQRRVPAIQSRCTDVLRDGRMDAVPSQRPTYLKHRPTTHQEPLLSILLPLLHSPLRAQRSDAKKKIPSLAVANPCRSWLTLVSPLQTAGR